ncbi:hypothetical protein HFO82_21925 [Rhizobium leguminosarum]|uniref:hypothetical protein n=1 Tax=Rhizobium leguminosarum TaxID=384 RepID=UPI001C941760|nr:hypothetical protein [Rhizobium leguminosarum]MBY5501258.1 hypothetical protein [Rhizobium leguminosarum]
MIPIKLHWERRVDGFEKDPDRPDELRARSHRTDPLIHEIADLEDPVFLHLVNCRTDKDLIAFLYRYGSPMNFNDDVLHLPIVRGMAEGLRTQAMSTIGKHLSPQERAHFVNEALSNVNLRPSFVYSEQTGRGRLILEADTLHGFMMMEHSLAYEAGAVATSCERCDKLFLTGPLTGRRSHAKFCSDRCRVAAMRARNAVKEG